MFCKVIVDQLNQHVSSRRQRQMFIRERNYPIEVSDPIEAIKIRMEEMHLKQVDLVDEIGGKSRVSEILNRKRKLTVEMIRNLNTRLNLSPGLLINDYQLMK